MKSHAAVSALWLALAGPAHALSCADNLPNCPDGSPAYDYQGTCACPPPLDCSGEYDTYLCSYAPGEWNCQCTHGSAPNDTSVNSNNTGCHHNPYANGCPGNIKEPPNHICFGVCADGSAPYIDSAGFCQCPPLHDR